MFPPERRLTYSLATASLLPGLVLCLLLRTPNLPVMLGESAVFRALMPREQAREDRAERALQDVIRRTAAKQAIALDLVQGRISLLEGAARMRDLDRAAPDFAWKYFRQAYPAASDDERHCLEAIRQVRGALLPSDPAGEAAALRFEDELRRHIINGTLRLRDPVDSP